MLTNTTTWEKAARERITYLKSLKNDSFNPFHEGYCRNIFLFLCYCKDIKWERFYKGVLNEDSVARNGRSNSNNQSSSDEDDDVFVTTMISEHQQQQGVPLVQKFKSRNQHKAHKVKVNESET